MSFRMLSALCGVLIVFATTARAAPVEGTDYVELKPPQSVDSPGKVEVIEFFCTAAALLRARARSRGLGEAPAGRRAVQADPGV